MTSPDSVPVKVVTTGQSHSGSRYASSTPLTVSPLTRTSLIVRTCDVAGDCTLAVLALAFPAVYGVNGRSSPRGTITTSPVAASPDGDRLKTMLPLRPVVGLEYSPVHFPASDTRSPVSPATVTGVGLEAHANVKAPEAAISARSILTNPPAFGGRRKGGR